ncbi:unnamed protein product [Schistocephalus solidus]|uniref:BACK domain-containing protein n=1 Tax=Schistocephalus solidus TaxID=70667 RepID=A0A183S8D3_SCHSO|nr:unnamed protein product [Schistocephalus solidus]
MPELAEFLACDAEAIEVNLMTKSRPDLQSLVTDIWRADFRPSSLIALEAILSALTMHEELLEVCEFVVDFLWRTALPMEYRESTTVFLTECHLPALISLEPFPLALLASILGGWENWQQVSKHLCSAVSYAFTSTDRIIGSAVHRRVCSCTSEPKYSIDQVLGFCSTSSLYPLSLPASWNVVLLGLVRLCFSLIDFASPSGRIGASADLHRRPSAACLSRRPPSRRAVTTYAAPHHFGTVSRVKHNARICRLAVTTLTEIFQVGSYVQLEQDANHTFTYHAFVGLRRVYRSFYLVCYALV